MHSCTEQRAAGSRAPAELGIGALQQEQFALQEQAIIDR